MKNSSNSYYDFLPDQNEFQREILSGLTKANKAISPKFLYDERGSELFEQICALQEYYPVHAEHEILRTHAKEMAAQIGEEAILIEPGCGNCVKVKYLLQYLERPKAYVALDISKDFLYKTALSLQEQFPNVPVQPIVADYTREFNLPHQLKLAKQKRVVFFPGSTIGNLHPHEATQLLKRMGKLVRPGGGLLIGVDRKKDAKTLELAYDDPKRVTAEFNFNLLDRLNREFSGSFDRKNFDYRAHYNDQQGRVEMFLVSRVPQWVKLGRQSIHFNENETIHTEDSYKYTPEEFIRLGQNAGFEMKTFWTDSRERFGVYYFEKT